METTRIEGGMADSKAISYSDLRQNFGSYFNAAINADQPVVVKLENGKSIVLMTVEKYDRITHKY